MLYATAYQYRQNWKISRGETHAASAKDLASWPFRGAVTGTRLVGDGVCPVGVGVGQAMEVGVAGDIDVVSMGRAVASSFDDRNSCIRVF